MKRTLFSVIAALACMLTFAQNVGDYVYTSAGRVKIVSSDNMIANGDFSNGTTGWTVDGTTPLAIDTFAVIDQAGPNGDNAIYTMLKDNGGHKGSCLFQKVPVSYGLTYYVSYYVKTDEDFTSAVSYNSTVKNYQNVFFNTNGNLYANDVPNVEQSFAKPVATKAGEWQKVEYSFTAPADGYLCIYMAAPYIGQCFADFKVLYAQIVPDDRLAAKAIAKLQSYIDDDRWTNGKEDLQDVIGAINEALAEDNLADFNAYINLVDDEVIPLFLDMNTENISSILDMQDFDEAEVSSSGFTSLGKWKITYEGDKPRWTVRAASTYIDSPLKTTHLGRSIPGNYELENSTIAQTVNLPAGKYMYTMRLNACRYTDKNNTTKVEDADIKNLFVFIGNDTIECTGVDTLAMNRYTVYTTLENPGAINVGFCMKKPSCHNLSLDLTELRSLDRTMDEVIDYNNQQTFAIAKQGLADKIAAAQDMYASKEYVFGKAILNDSIAVSQAVYNQYTEYSEENLDSVTNQAKRLDRAVSAYKTVNAEYVALAAAIAEGEEMAADESVKGDKTSLNTAISAGKTYYESLTVESERDSVALVGYGKAINEAMSALKQAQLSADEMFTFYAWSQQSGATYDTALTGEPIVMSSGSFTSNIQMYQEGGKFAGHDLISRFAFWDGTTRGLKADAGMTITSAKNVAFMSITGLKEGNEVTIDWSDTKSVFVGSGNVKYTDDSGVEHVLTKTGSMSNMKHAENQLPTTNTNGLNGTHRITLIMTKDGTLDLVHSSASTATIAYIGINYVATGVKEVTSSDKTMFNNYKVIENGRLVIKTADGTYSVAGVQMK